MASIYIKKQVYKREGHNAQTHWHPKQKTNAVLEYMKLGNLALTARTINIPEDTLRKWKQQQWWKDIEKEVRDQQKLNLNNKIDGIIQKSLNVVEDRLDNGDFVYDPKSGSVKRIGVKAAIANRISKDMMDQQMVLEKAINNKPEDTLSNKAHLANLLDEFLKFSKSKTLKGDSHEESMDEVKEAVLLAETPREGDSTSTSETIS